MNNLESNIYYQDNPKYFNELYELYNFGNHKGFAATLRYSKQYLVEWVIKITNNKLANNNLQTKIFWVINGITDYPKCANPDCNNVITDNVYRQFVGYNPYGINNGLTKCCSIYCLNKCKEHNEKISNSLKRTFSDNEKKMSIIESRKNTCLQKYGFVINVEKIKKSKQLKHGNPNYNNSRKNKETRLINNCGKYRSEEEKLKCEKTTLKHFGVKCSLSSEEVRKKGKAVKLLKYGNENYTNREKFLETLKIRYGKARCPQYVYSFNGLYFDSGSELCFYIFCKDHNINIKQSDKCFEYLNKDNKISHYFPDFEINDVIIEIKGDHFLNESNQLINPYTKNKEINFEKTNVMIQHNVKVIRSSKLKNAYSYVNEVYGKNFISNHRVKK